MTYRPHQIETHEGTKGSVTFPLRLGMGSFEEGKKMGGPRNGTLSRYLGRRLSRLRCGSVQNFGGDAPSPPVRWRGLRQARPLERPKRRSALGYRTPGACPSPAVRLVNDAMT